MKQEYLRQRITPSSILTAALFALLLVLLTKTIVPIVVQAPYFDGAMNLQVAQSIADGHGHRRNYAAGEVFPHEIQTGAPYLLPAAAVFKIAGVGLAQAQLVGIGYFLLLLLIAYRLMRQTGGRAMALLALCTVITVPGMLPFGFNGFGEIPALALMLWAVLIFFQPSSQRPLLRAIVTGVLLALAVITKTVMLIGACSAVLCIALALLTNEQSWPAKARRFAAVITSGAITLAIMETWRAAALGGFHAWQQWWMGETGRVASQAGVSEGFKHLGTSLGARFLLHYHRLGHDARLALWLLGLWLLALCAATVISLLRAPRRPAMWATLTVLFTALIYLLWWLLVTPTAKAWLRRILDGLICGYLGLMMIAGAWMQDQRTRGWPARRELGTASMVAVIMMVSLTSLAKGTRDVIISPFAFAKESALRHVAAAVRALPSDALVFGIGWYASPRVGLFSGRHLLDFNAVPVSRIPSGQPVYFVTEPIRKGQPWQRVRSLYGLPSLRDSRYSLVSANALVPVPLHAEEAPVERQIQASRNYPYMRGFNNLEGGDTRWLSDDNLILLQPSVGDHFELSAWAPPQARYIYPTSPQVLVSFDGCAAPPQTLTPGTRMTLQFAVPGRCGVEPGSAVNVRIEVDNLIRAPVDADPRPLSILAQSLGFVATAAP